MKKLFLIFAVMFLLMPAAARADEVMSDEDLIIRAAATSWPDAGLGAKTAICAVVLNRMKAEGFGDSAAAVIREADSGFDPARLLDPVDEKNLRMTRDAYMAAVSGADPTGGMLYFEKLPEPSRKDNRVEFEEEMDLSAYGAVIGGFGFYR